MSAMIFEGGNLPEGVFIASGTNPWVEVDGKPVDWLAIDLRLYDRAGNDCDGCGNVVPGAIEAMDTPEGIQCCDECLRIEGDLEAAQALAEIVGGTVHFFAMRQAVWA